MVKNKRTDVDEETGEDLTLSLVNVAGGSALELFQQELDKVLENILDPNTPAETNRKITLTVTFTPTPERTQSGISVECASKLAPFNGAGGVAFIGRRKGKAVAVPHNPNQMQMQWDAEDKPRVLRETGTKPQ